MGLPMAMHHRHPMAMTVTVAVTVASTVAVTVGVTVAMAVAAAILTVTVAVACPMTVPYPMAVTVTMPVVMPMVMVMPPVGVPMIVAQKQSEYDVDCHPKCSREEHHAPIHRHSLAHQPAQEDMRVHSRRRVETDPGPRAGQEVTEPRWYDASRKGSADSKRRYQ